MLWCRGGTLDYPLANHKRISALECTVWWQCTPISDRRTNIVAIYIYYWKSYTRYTQV